ncbi:hypothetical protein N7495_002672 [Penicillium taxi]|uniref:uncharacterized protein n=1 Tax=Penicillium taxi TaxID=168475 RepID=UPI002545A2B7|nr:uncharacterized protein N7495_002672 [Penicillium taxi]KAJ5902144.1 hypothetical protein N7495_002672 [Penicillium taxi]
MDAILDVYEAVSQFNYINQADAISTSEVVERVLSLAKKNNMLDRNITELTPVNTIDRVDVCCQLCSLIFWKLLQNPIRLESGIPVANVEDTKLLMQTLTKIESQYWIKKAPEALTWIVFTGAAASADEKDRGKFIQIGGLFLAAIDSDSLVLIRQGWRYFSVLKRLAGLSFQG